MPASKTFAIATVKKAAKYLMKHYKNYPHIKRGLAKEISTKHDHASEKILIDEIEE